MKERGTTGAGEPQITGVPRVHRHLKYSHGRGTTGNAILLCLKSVPSNDGIISRPVRHHTAVDHCTWSSPSDTMCNDPRQSGDGRGEVIPSFDGTDFRQYEMRVRLFVSNTRVAPARRARKLVGATGRMCI